ncbi:unnamed protein product [Calypogeia fissa]
MAMAVVLELTSVISTRAACTAVARRSRLPSAASVCAQSLSSLTSPPASSSSSWSGPSALAVTPTSSSTASVQQRRCNSSAVSQSSEAALLGLIAPHVEEKCILGNLSYTDLEAWVESLGFKKGQALMLWRFLYGNGKWAASVDEMSGLSKEFREALLDKAELNVLKLKDVHTAADGTRKIVFSVEGGSIETVVIPCTAGRGRTTVCVSSQVGCAMNCQFCFTGRMGLKRNLSTAEIVEQVVVACRIFSTDLGAITNVVFMGMGEPLHNADNVIRAANIMIDSHGLHLSHNKVTISTSGLVPQIQQFYKQSICALAVSLNATTDEVRNWIMPINRKYNLNLLLKTLREESCLRPGRSVFFEYVMLAGVNDSIEDAHRLVKLVEGISCKINLICFNPHSESGFRPSPKEQMLLFRDVITNAGLTVHIRQSRGDDQMAACGQLGTLSSRQAPRLPTPKQFQAAVAA